MTETDPLLLRRMLALRRFPMFRTVELAEVTLVAENAVERTFAPGAAVPPALHLIVEGEVATTERSYPAGEIFGGLHVLAQRELTARAVAVRTTHTLEVRAQDVLEVLEESPGVMRATIRDLAALVASRGGLELGTIDIPRGDPLGFVERLTILRRCAPFAGAHADGLAQLAHSCDEIRFAAGAMLARAGELASTAFIRLDSGEPVAALEMLGELPHRHTIEAPAPLRALALPAATMYEAIEDHTDLGIAIIKTLAGQLLSARS